MSSSQLSTKTLDLLVQYDSHILEKDKFIEHIERQSDPKSNNNNNPSYDNLFKENIRLKLQIQEYEAEIQSLKQTIEILKQKNSGESNDASIDQIQINVSYHQTVKKELVLPTRSIERKNNGRGLKLPDIQSLSEKNDFVLNTPKINPQEKVINTNGTPPLLNFENNVSIDKNNTMESSNNILLNSKLQNQNIVKSNHINSELASPATSVTYTTSRISITSPKNFLSSPMKERMCSPQKLNRITSVINNHLRSPLRDKFEDKEIDFDVLSDSILPDKEVPVNNNNNGNDDAHFIVPESLDFTKKNDPMNIHDSLVRYNNTQNNNTNLEFLDNKPEFSPVAQTKIENFTQLPENSSGETKLTNLNDNLNKNQTITNDRDVLEGTQSDGALRPNASQQSSSPISSSLKRLGPPVLLDQKNSDSINTKHSLSTSLQQETNPAVNNTTQNKEMHNQDITSLKDSSNGKDTLLSAPNIHSANTGSPHSSNFRISRVSTIKSNTNSIKSEIPLFIQPEDFGTIKIKILSTLYQERDVNHGEYLVLLSVIDRKSEKEIFKFAKSVLKIRELDVYLKSHISSLSLPTLPERALFQTVVPSKISLRNLQLNSYFQSIFSIPEIPPHVGLKIAQFLSTDTVVKPMVMEDNVKRGNIIVRRPKKALGNQSSWKIKYAVLNGDTLHLLEGNQTTEIIKLRQCTLEIIPNLPDDKFGTKNGFLICEHKKSSLSSSSKYYICTETFKERESWVLALNEIVDHPVYTSHNRSSSASSSNHWINSSKNHNDHHYPMSKIGSSFDSTDYGIDLIGNSYEQKSSLFINNQYTTSTNTDSLPRQVVDQNDTLDEREARRLKMRSIFPFKKLNLNSMTSSTSTASSHIQSINDTLDFEAVTVVSQNSIVTSLDGKHKSITDNQPSTESLNKKTVFGSSLDKCLTLSSHMYQNKYEIPSVAYRCLEYLYKNHGLREEGVFRLSGSSTLIKLLQEKFDKEYDVDLCTYEHDTDNAFLGVNTVSGLFKLFLRSLPHSIFGDEQYLFFKQIVDENYSNPREIALGFRSIIETNAIPKTNLSLMYSLFELLNRIADNNKYNKMNLRNLCIVFSPTLNIPIVMLQPFIVDFKCIFKGEDPIPDNEREQFNVHIPQL